MIFFEKIFEYKQITFLFLW